MDIPEYQCYKLREACGFQQHGRFGTLVLDGKSAGVEIGVTPEGAVYVLMSGNARRRRCFEAWLALCREQAGQNPLFPAKPDDGPWVIQFVPKPREEEVWHLG